ncbi:MAG: aspartate-semialdehyde dehydrogenase, partial [Bacteroidetes bacterium]|nr:aspartate-semialdehyde dehydrogenase [Bacteroidota bacterium]
EPSLRYARAFASLKTTVIDNSSAWRKDTQIPLVVPEVNGHVLNGHQYIISNPNCSTIQMVMVLNPLHKRFEIERVVVSTYQSVTGTGYKALHQLENERKGLEGTMAYPHPIDMNLIPHGGYFMESGYTSEEEKLVHETQKIMEAPDIRVTATVVRVPLTGGHSEAANIAFKKPFQMDEIREILQATAGVVVVDDPSSNQYPMPLYARGKDEVFVGRIRRDETLPHALNLFIVADNLRKGAATNAVQIAEYLHQRNLLHNLND